MIEPYQALGLVPTMRGIRGRDDIAVNLEHLSHLIKAASWLSSLDLPVRLIAIPEGAPRATPGRSPSDPGHQEPEHVLLPVAAIRLPAAREGPGQRPAGGGQPGVLNGRAGRPELSWVRTAVARSG